MIVEAQKRVAIVPPWIKQNNITNGALTFPESIFHPKRDSSSGSEKCGTDPSSYSLKVTLVLSVLDHAMPLTHLLSPQQNHTLPDLRQEFPVPLEEYILKRGGLPRHSPSPFPSPSPVTTPPPTKKPQANTKSGLLGRVDTSMILVLP